MTSAANTNIHFSSCNKTVTEENKTSGKKLCCFPDGEAAPWCEPCPENEALTMGFGGLGDLGICCVGFFWFVGFVFALEAAIPCPYTEGKGRNVMLTESE